MNFVDAFWEVKAHFATIVEGTPVTVKKEVIRFVPKVDGKLRPDLANRRRNYIERVAYQERIRTQDPRPPKIEFGSFSVTRRSLVR